MYPTRLPNPANSDRSFGPVSKFLPLSAALMSLACQSAQAANFVMSGSDAPGANSFSFGTNWTGGAAPVTGNTYQTGAFRIRSSNSNIGQTFAGDSLEINAGGNFRNKTSATVTVNNLILADTAIVELTQPNNTNGASSVGTLAGNISLTSGTAVLMAGNSTDSPLHVFTVSSTISGSGGLTTGNAALTVGGATAQSNGTVILTGNNTFAGGVTANGMAGSTLKLSGSNTYSGATLVLSGTLIAAAADAMKNTSGVTVTTGGTLLLEGSGDRINNSGLVTLSGGKFNTGGLSETLGVLSVGAAGSVIDMGAGTSVLTFANSAGNLWAGGGALSIWNWTGALTGGGTDQLQFSAGGLSGGQLAAISFLNPAGHPAGTYGATLLGSGELVPVPEPGPLAALWAILGLVTLRAGRSHSARNRRSQAR